MEKLIAQGAEAKIFLVEDKVVKDRIPKTYRHPELDEQIRRRRTKSEGRILFKALEVGVNVPKLLSEPRHILGRMIHMEYIEGDKLSDTLNDYPEEKQFQTMNQIGEQVALLHKNNIIHGDLTTSNMILNKKVYILDFGLGFISTKIEDKAVDLHLIKQALEAKHFQNNEDLFQEFSKGYKWEDSDKVQERLLVVEKRGRYKH